MSVNLFPFLSILVCIIGCLTLIIVVLNLAQMNKAEGKTEEEISIAQEYMAIEKEQEEERKELDKLRNLIEELIQENRDVIAKRDKLQRLKEMKENQEEIDESRNELIAQINALQAAIEGLDQEYPEVVKEIKEIMAELKRRDLPPDPPRIRVRPSGSGTSNYPFFVEAAEGALMIHRSLSEEPVAVPLGALNQNKDFTDLLKQVASQDYNRIIFLVRGSEGSVKSFERASQVINAFNRNNNLRIIPGRLPIPAEGKVDLTPFAQFLRP